MDRNKQTEVIRKRNAQLNKQLEELKLAFAYDKTLNREGYKHAKNLIAEIEKLKNEWEDALDRIRKTQEEYQMLVEDLKKFRDMTNRTEKMRLAKPCKKHRASINKQGDD